MFEVFVTYRSDFSEQSLGHYPTLEEAQEAARQLAEQNYDKVVRARVRAVRLSRIGLEGGLLRGAQVEAHGAAEPSEIDYSVRSTPGGRHVALSLDLKVEIAEQVRAIYSRIKEVEGLTLLL